MSVFRRGGDGYSQSDPDRGHQLVIFQPAAGDHQQRRSAFGLFTFIHQCDSDVVEFFFHQWECVEVRRGNSVSGFQPGGSCDWHLHIHALRQHQRSAPPRYCAVYFIHGFEHAGCATTAGSVPVRQPVCFTASRRPGVSFFSHNFHESHNVGFGFNQHTASRYLEHHQPDYAGYVPAILAYPLAAIIAGSCVGEIALSCNICPIILLL